MNYVKLLRKDTGLEEAAEIKTANMMDREGWRDRARRASGPPTGWGEECTHNTAIFNMLLEHFELLRPQSQLPEAPG